MAGGKILRIETLQDCADFPDDEPISMIVLCPFFGGRAGDDVDQAIFPDDRIAVRLVWRVEGPIDEDPDASPRAVRTGGHDDCRRGPTEQLCA